MIAFSEESLLRKSHDFDFTNQSTTLVTSTGLPQSGCLTEEDTRFVKSCVFKSDMDLTLNFS